MNAAAPDVHLLTVAAAAVARDGWRGYRPVSAARAAGIAPGTLVAVFPTAVAIGAALIACADQAMLAGDAGADLAAEPPRDRLYDLLMRRFDALAPHRGAVAAALDPRRACPLTHALLAPRVLHAMALALDAAGLRADPVRVALLLAADFAAARAFSTDSGADLATTMAALDQALKRAPERLFAA